MTTNTKNTEAVRPKTHAELDLDTKLAIASIGMDVRLELAGGEALAEAKRTAQDIMDAAPVENVTDPSAYVLKAAAQIIRTMGWTQGAFVSEKNGAVCALGAIRIVCGGSDVEYPFAVTLLMDRIREDEGHNAYRNVALWNDHPDRTLDEVLAMMEG